MRIPEVEKGRHALSNIDSFAAAHGITKPLIATGKTRRCWPKDMFEQLDSKNLPFAVFDEITLDSSAIEGQRGAATTIL